MPGLSHLLDDVDDDSRLQTRPELFKLMLPSQLSPMIANPGVSPAFPLLKHAFDMLRPTTRSLKSAGFDDSSRASQIRTRSTSPTPRHRDPLQGDFRTIQGSDFTICYLYRHARRALVALDPKGEITQVDPPASFELKDADIRGPGREEDEPSEGRHCVILDLARSKPSQPLDASPPTPTTPTNRISRGVLPVVKKSQSPFGPIGQGAKLEQNVTKRRSSSPWKRCGGPLSSSSGNLAGGSRCNKRTDSATPPDPQVQHGLRAYANRQASIYSSKDA
jgi:hypothetical protein